MAGEFAAAAPAPANSHHMLNMSLDTPSERHPPSAPLRLNETFDLADLGRPEAAGRRPNAESRLQPTQEETGPPIEYKLPPEETDPPPFRSNGKSPNSEATDFRNPGYAGSQFSHSKRLSSTNGFELSNGDAVNHSPAVFRSSIRQERTESSEKGGAGETERPAPSDDSPYERPIVSSAAGPTTGPGGPQLLSTISQITDYDSSTSDSAEAAAAAAAGRARGSPLRVVLASRIPRRLSSPGLPGVPLPATAAAAARTRGSTAAGGEPGPPAGHRASSASHDMSPHLGRNSPAVADTTHSRLPAPSGLPAPHGRQWTLQYANGPARPWERPSGPLPASAERLESPRRGSLPTDRSPNRRASETSATDVVGAQPRGGRPVPTDQQGAETGSVSGAPSDSQQPSPAPRRWSNMTGNSGVPTPAARWTGPPVSGAQTPTGRGGPPVQQQAVERLDTPTGVGAVPSPGVGAAARRSAVPAVHGRSTSRIPVSTRPGQVAAAPSPAARFAWPLLPTTGGWHQMELTIEKNPGLGFSIAGGSSEGGHSGKGVYISRVHADSPAWGVLRPGDLLQAVDDCDLSAASHEHAVNAIVNTGSSVRLRLLRPAAVQ
ncbi:nascent polypeptide-associated complex subunit alpha, muscle-specific form-like [Amphibalanus amphitrite]|uniref:nascent polypeptide-associated complex subunit alpha, muscle-specific form-like n=1 Tax=Amphibalanus amphitrite TaxID=1232801 RepID=UPI001C91AD16|nr:nascent polypeptide-associated complex subunit alpha, muscle-specific form-like [Amphibalanus amphitrite]